jgi:DNA (cytosine-5)-methyltransferase 1
LERDGIAVDVITGGFPCQDISSAGKQAGIGEGTRSGLWSEIVRLTRDLRPRYVIVENVANLLSGPSEQRGGWFGRVLGDLAECGYDVEWQSLRASDIGAWHHRNRIWITGWPASGRELADADEIRTWREADARLSPIPAEGSERISEGRKQKGDSTHAPKVGTIRPYRRGSGSPAGEKRRSCSGGVCRTANLPDPTSIRQSRSGQPFKSVSSAARPNWEAAKSFASGIGDVWRTEPAVGRVADGVPNRVDRLGGCGNAVVPQFPELIGHAILEAERGCM